MIYSSGRESYFNLNSTWYDPSGSWLDTRRTPFRYGYNTCSSGCDGEGIEGMRGHNYRHYGYRQPVCSERCHGYAAADSCHGGGGSSCVRRPTYSYGSSGGCHSHGRSVCSETCHGSGYRGGKPCYSKPAQRIPQCCPVQTCPPPVQTCPPPVQVCPPPVQVCPPPVQVCPPPVQVCPPPVQVCPPPVQQGCMPMAKCIPSQQQKVCKVPARKIK
ncbi:uncharacterized protein LOC104038045 [Pelecanus crispus]|uniref:uncharacterized protein LOC104038045 n=1 Tax=Pelecanus crispus TaxID=36300 RepID=UPI003F5D0E15